MWEIWVCKTENNTFHGVAAERPMFPRERYKTKLEAKREAAALNKVPFAKRQWTYEVRKVSEA